MRRSSRCWMSLGSPTACAGGPPRWASTTRATLYRWGRPDCLLRFPHLRLQDKLRYALHVMYTKGVKDWRALDRIEATGWLRRWVGERAYRGALAAALRAQVLRACPGALGGLDRHPHQAGCPLAQEPLPGGARLPGGRLPGAARRLPHAARGPGRAHPAQGPGAAGHDRRRTGHRRGGRGSNPPRRGGHLHRAPQVRAPLRAGSDGRRARADRRHREHRCGLCPPQAQAPVHPLLLDERQRPAPGDPGDHRVHQPQSPVGPRRLLPLLHAQDPSEVAVGATRASSPRSRPTPS